MKTILLLTLEFLKMAYCPYTGTFQNKKRIFGAYFGHPLSTWFAATRYTTPISVAWINHTSSLDITCWTKEKTVTNFARQHFRRISFIICIFQCKIVTERISNIFTCISSGIFSTSKQKIIFTV